MSSSCYRCCDCGEIKATKSDLEAHLNSDHIGWTPYQCYYCCQQSVSTRKPNKEMLKGHVTERHPNKEFTFLCTDEPDKNQRLQDMLNRSSLVDPSPTTPDNICSSTPVSIRATNPETTISPFIISVSTPPQTKQEIIDIEEDQSYSPITSETVIKTTEQTDVKDVKPNLNILGNCKCETCQQSVPRNLKLIRDHVKVHFKEQTGCVPTDLTNLLPKLQQVYCQLLIKSFPSVGASILDDDIPNCNKTTDDPLQMEEELRDHAIDTLLVAGNCSSSSYYDCNKCGRLASLKTHLTTVCKLDDVSETPKNTTNDKDNVKASVDKEKSARTCKVSSSEASCDVCGETFGSKKSAHVHRFNKHGIRVQWYCKQCNIDFKGIGSGLGHLLRVHMKKNVYECSLCSTEVFPSRIDGHNEQIHDGLGKAVVINNMHRYRVQVEDLRKELIIDRNSSNTNWKSKKRRYHQIVNEKRKWQKQHNTNSTIPVSSETSKNVAKFKEQGKCEICDESFASRHSLNQHRTKSHDIRAQWCCKRCNIILTSSAIGVHLLRDHMGKKPYVCSLCNVTLTPFNTALHDLNYHGGLGNAQSINNLNHYQKEIEQLRDRLIIDVNSENSTKIKSNSCFTKSEHDNLNWLSRFKTSQKRKYKKRPKMWLY